MQPMAAANEHSGIPEFLAGGGEMGARIREYDWSGTPLGPIQSWPHSLRTCIRIMLTSRQPIWIGWGKELIKFYNDPYKAIVGGKHPRALGSPASVVWKDIWKDIEPMLKRVMENDEGTYAESQLLIMERNGYPEETYYTFSYTPIPGDDGGTAGMICANTDDTDRIISQRQLRTLTHLGKCLTGSRSNDDIISRTLETLKENAQDFPFVRFYCMEADGAKLFCPPGVEENDHEMLPWIDFQTDAPVAATFKEAATSRSLQVLKNLDAVMGPIPRGAWEVPAQTAIVLPIGLSGNEPYGFLVIGQNPYRLLDEKYSSFFLLAADQVANSFSEVHRLEEERKRAEALAVIDKAKTTFFSNISHEFRTPLTLLMGPIQDTLNDPGTILPNRNRMELAYRNVLRMQKLVNTLLEFSRIEAGRVEGKFSRVDIVSLTQDLSGTFRSAIEKAGMQLHFNANDITGDVYVDKEMWEKIVLNLISNAFKYSRQGVIEISVMHSGYHVQLVVSDTGVGIPADQLDKIFERFHRVETSQGRSQEGTGIGLAMVKELVKLHHGTIDVSSKPGEGSTFTVTIPMGRQHLPDDKIVESSAVNVDPTYSLATIQEALKWIPEHSNTEDNAMNARASAGSNKYKVVLADDNSDMRQYVQYLLSDRFDVVTAVDGQQALDKMLAHKPDLLLSDVMMPGLDGFELLEKVRNHPDLKNIPVIFLSARAGEEAKVEGLSAGADDYLVKPFSTKELVARVEANIKISRARIAAENNLRNVIRQSPVAMTILKGEHFIIEMANEKALELWGKPHKAVINRPTLEAFPELVGQGFFKILNDIYTTGQPFIAQEMPVMLERNGKPELLYINFTYEPLRNVEGMIEGIVGVGIDVSEEMHAKQAMEQSSRELNEMANAMPQLVWMANQQGDILYYNDRITGFSGAQKMSDGTWSSSGLIHPEDLPTTRAAWKHAIDNGIVYQVEHRMLMKDGSYRWHLTRSIPLTDETGHITKWFGTATDIHASREQSSLLEDEVKKRTRELNEMNISLQQSNKDLQQFAHVASHDLREPLRKIKTFTGRLADEQDISFSEKAAAYIGKINSASDRMLTMIEGVLNYSMINAMEQKTGDVNLDEVMHNIESDLELLISQKKATIHYEHLPTIEGAAVLLYQLFYNLINNSLKFSSADTPPVIVISSSYIEKDKKQFVIINVEDNGIGFEQAQAEKIFDTFARLNPKDRFEGTGLGLSLCRRIVQRHGGDICATGEKGKGATFMIELPVKQGSNNI
jgi:PAS domain S-box-containing protein